MKPRNVNGLPTIVCVLVFICVAGCGSENETPAIEWPPARNSHSSAFNSDTGELLIFGGTTQDREGEDNGLWSYKNSQWTLLSSSGPGKREDALMVYHSRNRKIYLIGGRNISTNTSYQDFWEWNGTAWSKSGDQTPFGSLTHSAATYDQKNDRILIFGGLSSLTNSLVSDTWSWNGSTWQKNTLTGPAPRLASSLIYSFASEKVYLFGGSQMNGAVFQEVWELDGLQWTKLNTTMPNLLTPVAPMNDKFILFGGFKPDGSAAQETSIFENNVWTSFSLNPPTARVLHSLTYDMLNKSVWMFGGGTGGTMLDELWEYRNGSWSQKTRQ